ncbi:Pimeloyl-ACP methyl ester carboxylesterase [Deinococcus hopiensis KR-140]|uniref:Pimeloyl-ACP methyl ester carboxylesterase n=2 Tax=Deinococcus TaxID=1298 RepID=A0A1W1UN67_9DEIO|nr:Pimeloyl-ACP methyl ester carboxylesterase [Deinococcus hopiensis KR-140]
MQIADRLNTRIRGSGERTLLFAHGFCSTQEVFDRQVEAFAPHYRTVTFDLAGFGASHPSSWHPERHSALEGYAADLVDLIDALDLQRITLVGASMSAMTGLMASVARPERFEGLVFVSGSPRYLNGDGYFGGFDRESLDGFYALVGGSVYWRKAVTDMLLNLQGAETLEDVARSVDCTRTEVAYTAARAIFESDCRCWLARARHPVLVTQTRADEAVPEAVGHYLAQALPDAQLAFLPGRGHLPMRTQPEALNALLSAFLERTAPRAG